jgi:hypothetical protein
VFVSRSWRIADRMKSNDDSVTGLHRILDETKTLFASQGRLIRLPPTRDVVFVGDTHGDLDATECVLSRYLPTATIVFLGDAVDRGPDSLGNLKRILNAKRTQPDSIYLLMGNHEAWAVAPFSPADFWCRLDPEEERDIAAGLMRLPFAAWHPAGVLALHGALPDVLSLDELASIEPGSQAWRAITWGDWHDAPRSDPSSAGWGRPMFGRNAFTVRAQRLGVVVLVRSHQPSAPTYLFGDRCLTVFTSTAYGGTTRHVAVLRTGRTIETARDLELVEI